MKTGLIGLYRKVLEMISRECFPATCSTSRLQSESNIQDVDNNNIYNNMNVLYDKYILKEYESQSFEKIDLSGLVALHVGHSRHFTLTIYHHLRGSLFHHLLQEFFLSLLLRFLVLFQLLFWRNLRLFWDVFWRNGW